jgi:hypothetical protein
VAEFLSDLQQLTQLTHLDLEYVLDPVATSAAAYAALTASSKLHMLRITGCQLPPGVWQHILPTGRPLPHLQDFRVGFQYHCPTPPALMRGADVSNLAGCCPKLRVLEGVHPDGEAAEVLAPLISLTGLQCLEIWSQRVSGSQVITVPIDDAAMKVLAQLTGLTSLVVRGPIQATGVGLLQLTSLRQLPGKGLSASSEVATAQPDEGRPFFNSGLFDSVRPPLGRRLVPGATGDVGRAAPLVPCRHGTKCGAAQCGSLWECCLEP